MKQEFYVVVEERDWFQHYGANNPSREKVFDTLEEAWAYYKESVKKDFCWPGDHERTTHKPQVRFVTTNQIKKAI